MSQTKPLKWMLIYSMLYMLMMMMMMMTMSMITKIKSNNQIKMNKSNMMW